MQEASLQVQYLVLLDQLLRKCQKKNFYFYSRSSPCDHSRKRPAVATTTFVKPHLSCDLNFVMKSSGK